MTSYEIAFLFPGQGTQAIGMGVALAASHRPAKQVIDEVNDALGENLFEIMANGPDDLIRMTRNAGTFFMNVKSRTSRSIRRAPMELSLLLPLRQNPTTTIKKSKVYTAQRA